MAVFVPVRLTQEQMKQFKTLSARAIRQAITDAISDLIKVMPVVTPKFTGRLRESFKIRPLPYGTGIMMMWSAKDPKSSKPDFDYAKVADTGRPKGKVLRPKTKKAMAFPVPWQSMATGKSRRVLKKAIQGAVAGKRYSEFMADAAMRALIERLGQQFTIMAQGGS
jgi:hypothetical protein